MPEKVFSVEDVTAILAAIASRIAESAQDFERSSYGSDDYSVDDNGELAASKALNRVQMAICEVVNKVNNGEDPNSL